MDLASDIKSEGGKLTERKAVQKIVQPCLTALADLHAIGVSHGAIAPHSIVYSDEDATCKLAGKYHIHLPWLANCTNAQLARNVSHITWRLCWPVSM